MQNLIQIDFSLGFVSYLVSSVLFALVLLLHLVSRRKGQAGKPFLLLISASTIWSALLTLSQIGPSLPFEMIMVAELLRYFTWIYVLQVADGKYRERPYAFNFSDPLSPLFVSLAFGMALATVVLNGAFLAFFGSESALMLELSWMLFFSVIGLVVVEQLYRNTSKTDVASVRFICLSAGAIFIYDFFVFSNAVLTMSVDYEFWSSRGIVNTLIVPVLVLAAVRNPSLAPDIHISRKFVFHSTALISTGAYLVLMSAAGYYIKISSGDWGKVLQAAFLFGALVLLAVMFFSNTIKARLKRYLSYSFRNKYDYRDEWNRFSQTLLVQDAELSLYARALKAIAQIVDAQSASLWLRDGSQFFHKADWKAGIRGSQHESVNSPLVRLLEQNQNLISQSDLAVYCEHKKDCTHWLVSSSSCWLVVPLWLNNQLFGYAVLGKPAIETEIDMEDMDLLKTVADHVSLSLFLKKADAELQEAQRFKDMNQMTAFLVHDLKTVLSQLSLLVSNAQMHKSNPAFVDDMISTVDHATQKMQRLLQQLREPPKQQKTGLVDVVEILQELTESYRHNKIQPRLQATNGTSPQITADREQLKSAFKHLIQNAVESIQDDGEVFVSVAISNDHEWKVKISDTGQGMTQEFISERLFRPFDSTKGVSGMGVGVYQSRDYIRSLSGDIEVQSKPGEGSIFTITLPIAA